MLCPRVESPQLKSTHGTRHALEIQKVAMYAIMTMQFVKVHFFLTGAVLIYKISNKSRSVHDLVRQTAPHFKFEHVLFCASDTETAQERPAISTEVTLAFTRA